MQWRTTRWRFASYVELVSASCRMAGDRVQFWLVTPLPAGAWIAWNEEELQETNWDSRQAAEEWIRRGAATRSTPAR